MPFDTYWETRGIVWTFYGDVTAQEIADANAEFYNSDRSIRAKYQIIDALRTTSVEWNDRQIKEMAAYDIGADRVIKHLKVAYITQDAEIQVKMEKYIDIARMLNTSWQFKGFTDLASARAWLEG